VGNGVAYSRSELCVGAAGRPNAIPCACAAKGILKDLPVGFPRTTAQGEYLDEILADGGQRLDVVLRLTADDEEPTARLLGRAKETGRSNDNHSVIRHRLKLYHEIGINFEESEDGVAAMDSGAWRPPNRGNTTLGAEAAPARVR
jgi:hypothetical protein